MTENIDRLIQQTYKLEFYHFNGVNKNIIMSSDNCVNN